MTIPISSGGGIPIRGIQLFDSYTPDDFTFQGQRFLRHGVLETDTNLFDTEIWNVKNLLPDVLTDISGLALTNINASAGVEKVDGTLIAPNAANGMVSIDGGVTWVAKTNLSGTKTRLYEIKSGTNAGRLVYGVQDNSGGLIRWSDDNFDTVNSQAIGVGGDTDAIAVAGSRVLAVINAAYQYSTNDDLTVWATATGTLYSASGGSNDEFATDGVNTIVMSPKASTNSNNVTYSLDGGASWTAVSNAFGTSASLGGCMFYDDFTALFKCIKEVTVDNYNMWTSPDGITWTDVGEVSYPYSIIGWYTQVNPLNGVIVQQTSATSSDQPVASVDGGFTWFPMDSFPAVKGSGVQTGSIPLSDGTFILYDRFSVLSYNYDLYAGIYATVPDGDVWQDFQSDMTFVRVS